MRVRHAGEATRALAAAGERAVDVVFTRAGVVERTSLSARQDGSIDVELKIRDAENALRREWLRSRG
jgi:hypothetical protein